MSFAALQRAHASFIAAHGPTETIEYRPKGHSLWTSIPAQVVRNPVDVVGQLLANTIDVFVSRDDVASVSLGGDSFRLPGDLPPEGGSIPLYRVTEILTRADGFYQLRCMR